MRLPSGSSGGPWSCPWAPMTSPGRRKPTWISGAWSPISAPTPRQARSSSAAWTSLVRLATSRSQSSCAIASPCSGPAKNRRARCVRRRTPSPRFARAEGLGTWGWHCSNLGGSRVQWGDPSAALAPLLEGADIVAKTGERDIVGFGRLLLGLAWVRLGDLDQARGAIADGARVARESGVTYDMILAVEVAADWLGACGVSGVATRLWAAADAARASVDVPRQPMDTIGRSGADARSTRPWTAAFRRRTGLRAITRARDGHRCGGRAAGHHHHPGGPVPVTSHGRDRYRPTPRELDVLALLVDGHSDGEIASRLFISKKTASVHVANLKGKLRREQPGRDRDHRHAPWAGSTVRAGGSVTRTVARRRGARPRRDEALPDTEMRRYPMFDRPPQDHGVVNNPDGTGGHADVGTHRWRALAPMALVSMGPDNADRHRSP